MPRIAVVAGSGSVAIQELLAATAAEWRAAGAKIVGVIGEMHGLPDRTCGAGFLRDVMSSNPYPIYLETPPRHTSCHLDAAGVARACAAILDQIPTGDLVVLNKFGKLEAMGEGLTPAFTLAIAAGKPVLTTVSEKHREAWRAFAPGSIVVDADKAALHAWWRAVRSPFRHSAGAVAAQPVQY